MTDTTEDTVPSDDLRSTLETAYREQSEPPAAETTPISTETVEAEAQADRNRDDKGRFTKYENENAGAQDAQAAEPTANAAGQQTEETSAPTQAVRPPPGWSPASKAAFDSLPDHIKADVAKREAEVSQGFAKFQDFKGLDPYVEHWKSQGISLAEAMGQYTKAERKLASDFTGGVVELCNTFRRHPLELAQELTRAFGGGADQNSQDASGASAQPDLTALLQQHIRPLEETINSLKGERDAQRKQAIKTSVQDFFDNPKNRYADNVIPQMIPLLNAGMSLEDAYEEAKWQNKEVREQLINEQRQSSSEVQSQAAAKAKQAAKSISGAPGQGTAPAPGPAETLRDELKRSLRSGGRV